MGKKQSYIDLIDGCKRNDRKAQKELYYLYFDKMTAMCRRYTQDEDQLITILNNGFLKVFKNIDSFNHAGSFEGWVRRCIFNSLSDYFRKENKYLKFLIFEDAIKTNSLVEPPSHQMYYQDIIQLLEKLPDNVKRVFELYAIEGYTHKEIGEMLEIPVGTSKWLLSNARKELRGLLKQQNNYLNAR